MKISNSISSEQIELFVDGLMKNKSINFSMIPDYIEKKLYTNVFTIVLNILDTILDSVNIEIMGHKIIVDITPKNEPISNVSVPEKDLEAQNGETLEDMSSELQSQLLEDFNKLHPVTSDGGLSSVSGDAYGEFNKYRY